MDKSLHIVFMYILVHLGLIFFLYPANIIQSTEQGFWLPISIGIVCHIIIVAVYLKGLHFFPKTDIITIYSEAGKFYSLCFLAPIFFYFLMENIILVRAYSEIITIVFLSNTPLWAVMALLLTISTYLASKGIEAIFRTGFIIAFVFLPLVFFVLIISFQNVDWYHFFPFWSNDFSFLTNSSYLKSFFAVGGGFIFLGFVQPYLSYKRKQVFIALTIIIPCFFLSVYIPVLTFGGSTASTFLFPFVMAVDAINLTWLMFDRITMFLLLSLLTFIMLFISLILWKTVRITNHYISSWQPAYLLVIISALIYIISFFIPTWSSMENLFKWNTFLRFYVLLSVPISIYILGVRRKSE
ncbi:GerAB/ArcD/ProY family transporter [Ornithinibacillus contaminans]|uniref:GerAB/ArcD/ProY family transporter n=1 Tax=Ornithinibacillus contaminans TaxID=694055 RepID=UPI00064D968D|nr:GerAB/ArcD/ProY family transporter [Ornithinibacillus contaminans]